MVRLGSFRFSGAAVTSDKAALTDEAQQMLDPLGASGEILRDLGGYLLAREA